MHSRAVFYIKNIVSTCEIGREEKPSCLLVTETAIDIFHLRKLVLRQTVENVFQGNVTMGGKESG